MQDRNKSLKPVLFEELIKDDLAKKDLSEVYELFGRFVAKFEVHVAQIKMCIGELFYREGLKKEKLLYVLTDKMKMESLLGLLLELLHEQQKKINGWNSSAPNDLSKLFTCSKQVNEIRNYLVHGNWTEFVEMGESFTELNGKRTVYIEKTTKRPSKAIETHYNLIDKDFFFQLNTFLDKIMKGYNNLSRSYRNDESLILNGFDLLSKDILELKTRHL